MAPFPRHFILEKGVWHVLGRIKMLGPLPELAKGEQKRDTVSAGRQKNIITVTKPC